MPGACCWTTPTGSSRRRTRRSPPWSSPAVSSRGTVVVGVFGSAAALLPAVSTAVRAATGDVRIRSKELDVDGAVAAVRRGEVDLAFGLDYEDLPAARDEDIAFRPVRTERFATRDVGGRRPARRRRRPRRRARPALDPAARRHALRPHDAATPAGGPGIEPDVVYEVMDTAASLALAAAGAGITPVTPLMQALAPDARLRVVALRQVVDAVGVPGRADPAGEPAVGGLRRRGGSPGARGLGRGGLTLGAAGRRDLSARQEAGHHRPGGRRPDDAAVVQRAGAAGGGHVHGRGAVQLAGVGGPDHLVRGRVRGEPPSR